MLRFICPLIVVNDMQRSRRFYENLLGQKVKSDFGENVVFEGDFAIHLQSHYENLIEKREVRPGSNSFELYFETDKLLELEAKLEEAGVNWIHKIRTEPWGQKVMRFYDPDGHIVEVGEPM